MLALGKKTMEAGARGREEGVGGKEKRGRLGRRKMNGRRGGGSWERGVCMVIHSLL